MRKVLKHRTFILLFFSLLVLGNATACTRSASTPPPEEVIVVQTVEVTRVLQAPTLTPLSPSEEPPPTGEPVSIFGDVSLNYYAYGWLVWAYENGYIEPCEVEGAPETIDICPEDELLKGDLYVSAARYSHQDADFEPVASTNLTFQDRGIEGHRYAAAAEELARQRMLPKHFLCNWPNVQYICPFEGATRSDGAVMIEVLAHTDALNYDSPYNGSWLIWPPYEKRFPDVAYAFGLVEDEVKAPEGLDRDGIYQRRSASSDFGPQEPLTVAVWAEWLYHAFQLFGPPKPVPTPSPTSSP